MKSDGERPKFSLVIPTRDRPEFVTQALNFIEQQEYRNFEVVIVDNPKVSPFDPYATGADFRAFPIKYVRVDKPLSMVDNWNVAFERTSGEWVVFLTDKTMLLPGALQNALRASEDSETEIVSWHANNWHPSYPNYFQVGTYLEMYSDTEHQAEGFRIFHPPEILERLTTARSHRANFSPGDTSIGKISSGAFRRSLCMRIIHQRGALFTPVSPDYTSRAAALGLARKGVQLMQPGILFVHADLSNGRRGSLDDVHLRDFLEESGIKMQDEAHWLIPYLAASTENLVISDYMKTIGELRLQTQISRGAWGAFARMDLDARSDSWSSVDVKAKMYKLLDDFVQEDLDDVERRVYQEILADASASSVTHFGTVRGRKIAVSVLRRISPTLLTRIQGARLGSSTFVRDISHFKSLESLRTSLKLNSRPPRLGRV